MREKLSVMSDRNFPATLIEMKKLASDSTRFRNEELPPRHRDKQHLVHLYKELQVIIYNNNNIYMTCVLLVDIS